MFNGTIIGRIGRDPETKNLPSGATVTEFSVAHSYFAGDRKTMWVKVSIFGKRGLTFAQYHKKGDLAAVSGSVQEDTWTAQDGTQRSQLVLKASDWDFASGKNERGQSAPKQPAPAPRQDTESDIPF